jgi:hypothetical protein
MFPPNDGRRCAFCKVGSLIKSDREIAFKQRTDKGYLVCRVTIPMEICDHCGSKTWDEVAEAIINEAIRERYKMMP